MKTFLSTFGLLISLISFTAQAADQSLQVLGVKAGVYQGRGTLTSQTPGIPNLGFISRRTLNNGMITASTKAYLLSPADLRGQIISRMVLGEALTLLLQMPIAEATAQLKVLYTDSVNFKLIDMKTKALAGNGFCGGGKCTFTARVNSGLELNETWTPQAHGFSISGSQNFYGLRSVYTAEMNPPPAQK